MKKQMTVMDMGIVFVAVIAAIIALSAIQRLNSPNLPAIQGGNPVISKDIEKSEAPTINSTAVEGTERYSAVVFNPATGQAEAMAYFAPSVSSIESEAAPEFSAAGGEGTERYSAVVFNPATGAELVEWTAPQVSSLSTNAAAGDVKQYSAAVFNPGTGQVEAVEYVAPQLSRAKSETAVEVSAIGSEGTKQYSTVVVTSKGAQEVEWVAPNVNSLRSTAAPETAIAAEGQKAFRTVVFHPETGAQLYEWQAPSVNSLSSAAGTAQYSTVVLNSTTGQAETVEWQVPKVR